MNSTIFIDVLEKDSNIAIIHELAAMLDDSANLKHSQEINYNKQK